MEVSKIDGKTIGFPQLRGSLSGVHYPAFAEVKYDGEFNYIVFESTTYTINKYGTMRANFPRLRIIEQRLKESKISSVVLVCELYWEDGKLGALYDLLSHKKDDAVNLKIFDIIELNGTNMRDKSLLDRREMISHIGLNRWVPQCWVVEDQAEAKEKFQAVTKDGYEGVVIKSFEGKFVNGPCSWVKMKYKDQSDYEVVIVDPHKERVEFKAPTGNGGDIYVGVKAPNKYKKHIKVGDMITIEHQGVLASGSLRHPVLIAKKEWK